MSRLHDPASPLGRTVRALAVLALLGLVACLGHGLEDAGDEHGRLHAACAPVAALLAAGVLLLALLTGTGWLIAAASPALVVACRHLPDPPPKRPARF